MNRRRAFLAAGVSLALAGVGLLTVTADQPLETHRAGDRPENVIRLWGSTTISQTVAPPLPNLSGVELSFAASEEPLRDGVVTLRIRESPEASEDLRTARVPVAEITPGRWTTFRFSPLDTRGRTTLALTIEYPSGTVERPLPVRAERPRPETVPGSGEFVDYPRGTLFVNAEPIRDGDLAFRLLAKDRQPFAVQMAGAAFLGGMALLAFPILTPRWATRAVVGILGTGLPVVFFLPLLWNLSFLGVADWDMNTTLHVAAARALLAEQTFPSWNPYLCGGTPLAAFPEAPVFSPFFATVLLGGPIIGFKVNIILHGIIGFLGMLWWLRSGFRTSWLAAFLGASVVLFSSFVVLHLGEGHSRKVAIAWIPWTLFFLHQALEKRHLRSTAPAGAALALMFLDGSVYLSLYTAAFVLLVSLSESAFSRRWSPLAAGLATLVVGGLLAGVKLVPTVWSQDALTFELELPRPALPLANVGEVFLDPQQSVDAVKFYGQPLPWSEYGAYIGIIPALLALLGVGVTGRRLAPWMVAGAFFLLGSFSASFQEVLRLLPIVGDLRNPQRMVSMVTVVVGLASAHGLDRFVRLLSGTEAGAAALMRRTSGVLTAIVIAHLVFVNSETLAQTFTIPPPPSVEQPFQQGWAPPYVRSDQDSFPLTYANAVQNMGSLNRCSIASVQPSAELRLPEQPADRDVAESTLDRPYEGEAFLQAGTGTATVERQGTSEVAVRYDVDTPAILALNQNFHPGWTVEDEPEGTRGGGAKPATPRAGLVTTDVEPGVGTITFSYTPPGLGLGFGVSALGLALGLWLWRRGSAQRP